MLASFMTDVIGCSAEAFAGVVTIALLATAVVLALHFVLLLFARWRSRGRKALARWNLWEKLVYLATIPAVALLAGTAFYAVIVDGVLEGWLLMAHMVGAGLFVAILPVITLTWAVPCQFGPFEKDDAADTEPAVKFLWLTKFAFWLMLVGGVMTAGTMLLSMLPLFDTDGLHLLLDVHRYSGLVVVVAASVHFYSVCVGRLGLSIGD